MTNLSLQPRVENGDRIYRDLTWTRKDTIYFGTIKIGYVYSSREDRQGRTVSIFNGRNVKGRDLNWCAGIAIEFMIPDENLTPAHPARV